MLRIFVFVVALLMSTTAAAHAMRVFARIDGSQISGYAFFVGGGRPSGVDWVAKMGEDVVAQGKTGPDGSYQLPAPSPVTDDIVITVDTREGHVANTRVAIKHFDALPAGHNESATREVDTVLGRPAAVQEDRAEQQRLIEAAVERQIGPVLERIELMDARMRLTDVLSGIFLIIGLAGTFLWIRSRKR